MTPLIREARAGDIDAVARVLVAAFEQYRPPPDAPVTPEHRAAFERYLQDTADVRSRTSGAELFVAEDAAEIVGAATLYPPHEPVGYPADVERTPWPGEWASLRFLAVVPARRGSGIGRMLAEARIERARALGAPVVALHTSAHFAASRRMYRRMGWEHAPAYDFWPAPTLRAEAYILRL